MTYQIATRGSKLALAQTQQVADALTRAYPKHTFTLCIIKTQGDLNQHSPLHQIGGKGVFVREIEQALLNGSADLAVHSMKDMPCEVTPGLSFSRVWKREDPRDVLVLNGAENLHDLPQGARIGTGSLRRAYQLRALRSDLEVCGIRGNIDTRLRKMRQTPLDGLVLAAAGLNRLSPECGTVQPLSPEEMIPAPAQGALAIQLREGDNELRAMLDALSDKSDTFCLGLERAFLAETGASCHEPVGAYCSGIENPVFYAMLGKESSERFVKKQVVLNREHAEAEVRALAHAMRQELEAL